MSAGLLDLLPVRLQPLLEEFLGEYLEVGMRHGFAESYLRGLLATLIERAEDLLDHPVELTPLHEPIRHPFDYLRFGLDFFEPLIDRSKSLCSGNWQEVAEWASQGHNTILLSNHQTEADPQLMHLLLRDQHDALAAGFRFMAGERVQRDPIATPFSIGRRLVCVYSRRHLDHPPERREEKLRHNALAMRKLKELLAAGGVTLYLAPSGGRDRPGREGEVHVADFDPDAVEMMRLLAASCGCPTLFRPLALSTYPVLPPPIDIHRPLGEVRRTDGGPIGMALGDPIDWESLPSGKTHRAARAYAIQQKVQHLYAALTDTLRARHVL
jgi:glycerol-3-phosphate O-acyltransferase